MPSLPHQIGRYEVRSLIGGGGMGDVYRVYDPVTRREIALKTLKFAYPRALHYFKREFRSIANLLHPNLVQLYDLHYENDQYFYTMELVEGCDLYGYVNGHNRMVTSPIELCNPERVARVRNALVQLLRALAFLHRHDVVHRDIKPSNVLVDKSGVVKLVDFGIVKELLPGGEGQSLSQVFGTSTYFSPEQSLGSRVNTATDLYAVGVVLYELLAGVPPFDGESAEVAVMHRTVAPPSLTDRVPGVSQELARVCMELLSKEPSHRPSAREVLETLHESLGGYDEGKKLEFVGRQAERQKLENAMSQVRNGEGHLVLIKGHIGYGKSALIHAFGREARSQGASTFSGVCVSRDHVSMRGLDTLIERLAEAYRKQTASILRHLPSAERAPLIADFKFLGELLAQHEHQGPVGLSSGLGLHTLLSTLGRDRLLVLAVEHIDAADEAAIDVLETLLTGGHLPSVLLILTMRTEGILPNSRLEAFLDVANALPSVVDTIELGPLSLEETKQILVESLGDASDELALHVHRETEGVPSFVKRMVHYIEQMPSPKPPSFDDVVRHAVLGLSIEAQRTLAAICLSPHPVPGDVLEQACGLEVHELFDALNELQTAELVRTEDEHSGRIDVALVHQHLAEVVQKVLYIETAAFHEALALAHQVAQSSAEEIRYHWAAIGQLDRAWRFAAHSALDARAAGHHERAADMLALALEAPMSLEQRTEWMLALSESLALTGHYLEAAHCIQKLTAENPQEGVRWRARMCQLFLMGGDLTGFIANVSGLPALARVPLADLLLLFSPVMAGSLLGDADSVEARLVRARLKVDETSLAQINEAERLMESCKHEIDDSPRMQMAWVLTKANVLWAQGHLDQAQALVEEAYTRLSAYFASFDLGGMRLNLLRAYMALHLGQISRARSIGRLLLAETRSRGLVGIQALASILQAHILLEAGEFTGSMRLLRSAKRVWPSRPISTPHIDLALANARYLFYMRHVREADKALDDLWNNEPLRAWLYRRVPMRIFSLLRARICAVLALQCCCDGDPEGLGNNLQRLEAALNILRGLQPYPGDWIVAFSAMAELARCQPAEAHRAIQSCIEQYGWPKNAQKQAWFRLIYAAALDGEGVGGQEERQHAVNLCREAGAALPPEAEVLRIYVSLFL